MNLIQRLATYGTLVALSACAPAMTASPLEAEVLKTTTVQGPWDPLGNATKLREGEFVVPNDVFRTYFEFARMMTIGLHHNRKNQDQLHLELAQKGYSAEEIQQYGVILNTPMNTILPEASLIDKRFAHDLRHERYHQRLDRLTPQETTILSTAFEDMNNNFRAMSTANQMAYEPP